MGAGLDAVKAKITGEFNVAELTERYDVDSMSTHVALRADGPSLHSSCVK